MTYSFESIKNICIALVWVMLAVLALSTMMRECKSSGDVRVSYAHDTIRMKPDSVVIYRDKLHPVYMKGSARVDTTRDTIIREILASRESTREALDSHDVRELLVLDSSAMLPFECAGQRFSLALRISDTCDCIARSIRTVLRTSDTSFAINSQKNLPGWALGIGICAGIDSGGRLAATLGLSFTHVLAYF